jgi:membrane protein implicated in regulation of membrane protease activity
MMKSLAPVALTGIAGVILWKVLQILMAPVIAWIIGVLAIALKIGLVIALACVAAYGIRRVMQSRADSDAAPAENDAEA